jgi:voltage-gated potassium channel
LTLLGVVVVFGVAGYMLINGWGLLDSLYMVIITISTVGYGEVHPQGTPGRIFSMALIMVGVATMLFGIGVFAEALADNAFGKYRRERQLQRDLDHLRDHFIICGYGRMGTQIVAEFEQHQTPYVVIDQTEEALERIRAEGRLHIEGDASKEDVLKQAGIERARGLVSVVDSDERAVYIVLAARALNSHLYIVARGGRPESLRRLELQALRGRSHLMSWPATGWPSSRSGLRWSTCSTRCTTAKPALASKRCLSPRVRRP